MIAFISLMALLAHVSLPALSQEESQAPLLTLSGIAIRAVEYSQALIPSISSISSILDYTLGGEVSRAVLIQYIPAVVVLLILHNDMAKAALVS